MNEAPPGRPPRVVATDLDGTLLRRDRTVSVRTVETLARISAAGTLVVLVTGRPLRWLPAVYEQLPAPLPAVCANGAVVYDPVNDEVLRADPLAPELLAEVVARLRAEVPEVSLAVEVTDSRQMRHESAYPVQWEHGHTIRLVDDPAQLIAEPAVKLLARSAAHDSDAFALVVSTALKGLAEATHSSYSGLVEISAAGVTKAAGLAWFCERHGHTADEVIAFGDMPNDVPMLTWAGRGVAVANAHRSVLAIADEVTASHEEDGVAAHLERLFPPEPQPRPPAQRQGG
ncbi:HAD family hydrolase [Solwaraspora sp. WMMD1047]|uniref:HAD family hydrolase n=1 Tax=Solwaraspora sp. WMMD1047 TaxID=3016102 RepID=UPI002415CF43|nr:HAD family hydrolase [Solwaraspora sp. WMMD1047]MDG4827716.1 HAD family hydrolase [Solwaraspora sp. WMMD1047]